MATTSTTTSTTVPITTFAGTAAGSTGSVSTVHVADHELVITVPRPSTGRGPRDERASLVAFAARSDAYEGLIMWHRYEAMHRALQSTVREAHAAADGEEGGGDVYTRIYDPVCQVASLYAHAVGCRQFTAELFVDRAVACMERIPLIGLLMRDGVLTSYWFRGALDQVSLVDDQAILDVIDAEAAERLRAAGALSRVRVEQIVAAVVAELDPDAARRTREAATAGKKVQSNQVDSELTELIVTADAADVAISLKVLDAIISGVCAHDQRTKQTRRADAAMARINGTQFVCECGRDDCAAELTDANVASRCARIVLHVIARRETLTGDADTPAYLDGHGPISALHLRDMAARRDAVVRDLDVGELADGMAQKSNPYRPTATCDAAVRGLFGQCTWPGCDRPAFESDLDHVCEFDHDDPVAGGPTCVCNLNPKCRFHHGLKTHVPGWVDDQIVDANGIIWTEVTSPDGMTVRSQALNSWLLPELGLIPCRHGPVIGCGPTTPETWPHRPTTRTQGKHRYRMKARAANRAARERELARGEVAVDYGQPPF